MGNNISKDGENEKRSFILLDDNFLHNFQKKDNANIGKKSPKLEKYSKLCKNNESAEIDEKENSNKSRDLVGHNGEEYDKLRKIIIYDLIKESETYINKNKEVLNDIKRDNIEIPQANNECFYDENKIYDCLKNMNGSTSDFINSYNRCYRNLRKYESCVQKIKI